MAFRKSSASPSVRPGNGTPDSVAELSCWKLVSAFGCTFSVTLATAESGTSSPLLVRDLVAGQPVGRQAELARRLRNDLVAAAIEIEEVDVVAAEHGRERRADVGHVDADAVRLVGVDLELVLRRIELEVDVGEEEEAAFRAACCIFRATSASVA